MSRNLPAPEPESQCTCGMELGKKLDSIEHLLSTAPKAVADGQVVEVDLRSSLPWGRGAKANYFEVEVVYGAMDEGSLKVQVDDKARRFRLDGLEKDLAWLQPEIEQRQLARMLADALVKAEALDATGWAGTLAATVRRLLQAAEQPKPLDAAAREGLRLSTLLAVEGADAARLRELCKLIDRSVERWFVPLAGLTPLELQERFAKVDRSLGHGDYANARRQLEELVVLLPESVEVRARRGALLASAFADHHLDEGIADLEKALAGEPAHRGAMEDLADAFLRKGELDRARQLYQKALEVSAGEAPRSLFGLGQLDELAGDRDGAYSHYVRAARKATEPRLRQVLDLCAVRVERKGK